MKKKIVIIDDHDTFRASLKQIINKSAGFEVAGEASDAKSGEAMVQKVKPDLTIVDLSLPDKSGIQVTKILKTVMPGTRIVIVSMHSKIDYIIAALRAGALGYLVKESVAELLIKALDAALDNEYFLDPALSQEVARRLLETADIADLSDSTYGNLTAREQEILRLLAQGCSSKEVAEKLYISSKTVTNHRANIFSKLDLHSTADLVRYAAKLGLLEDFS